MLSQIEHGSALPSLGTVNYIASRLNVSPGFLLADEDDERLYLKNAVINDIKKAYASKNYELCYDMCKRFDANDDEITLILAECSLRFAAEAFRKGELRAAAELLDESLELCSESFYNTSHIVSEARDYFSFMELISPTLYSSGADGEGMQFLFPCHTEFSVYSGILCEAEWSGWDEVALLDRRMELLSSEGMYFMHIDARIKIDRGDCAAAHEILHELLYSDKYALPEPMLYLVLCDIEICCKETDDFKGAYEYSSSKIALMQKLLG
jgi:transcriptional regulator with XRE-family HTH domain